MPEDELESLIAAAKKQAGINDVIKLHQDHVKRVRRNTAVLRMRYHKGIIVSSSSTY